MVPFSPVAFIEHLLVYRTMRGWEDSVLGKTWFLLLLLFLLREAWKGNQEMAMGCVVGAVGAPRKGSWPRFGKLLKGIDSSADSQKMEMTLPGTALGTECSSRGNSMKKAQRCWRTKCLGAMVYIRTPCGWSTECRWVQRERKPRPQRTSHVM